MQKVPVYICSKGRAGRAPTIDALAQSAHLFYVVVEPQELDIYRAQYPEARMLTLQADDQGITFARNFCLQHAKENGVERLWMLDDDINKCFYTENETREVPIEKVLCFLERETLPDTALISPEYQQFAWAAKKDFTWNSYCEVMVLIDLKQLGEVRYRENCKEDRDLVLQCLSKGKNTVRLARYGFMCPKNGSNKGGLSAAYKNGLEEKWAARMMELWPGICVPNEKKKDRTDVKIHWKLARQRYLLQRGRALLP